MLHRAEFNREDGAMIYYPRVGEVTELLNRMAEESGALRKQTYDRLVMAVYQDLRCRGRLQLRHERGDSLQPTTLVHEVYERLLNVQMPFHNREHFLNVTATAMHRLLIEQAQKANEVKRGGGRGGGPVGAESAVGTLTQKPQLLIDIDRALQTLRPEQVQLMELPSSPALLWRRPAIMKLKPETVKKRRDVVRTLLFERLGHQRVV